MNRSHGNFQSGSSDLRNGQTRKLASICKRVYFIDGFVGPDSQNPGKSQRQPAGMAIAGLNFVKCDLQHRIRLYLEITAILTGCGAEKVIGQFDDLSIGQSGVGFADSSEFASRFVADCESIITENSVAFAVSVFGADDDTIERCERLLQFQPGEAAPARCVKARRILDHQSLVVSGTGGVKSAFNLLDGLRFADSSQLNVLGHR